MMSGDESSSWNDAEAALRSVVDRIGGAAIEGSQWARVARGGAALVSRLAVAAEPAGTGPLSQLAGQLRMLASLRPEVGDQVGGWTDDLGAAARAFEPRHPPLLSQSQAVTSLITQLIWLLIMIAEREAERGTERQAGRADGRRIAAARSAALALTPLAGLTHVDAAKQAAAPLHGQLPARTPVLGAPGSPQRARQPER